MQVSIIGAGLAGLTAAYDLLKQGHSITLYEKNHELGGQAGTFAVGGTRLERFYHHLFTSDENILGLIDELGLSGRMTWIPSRVGWFYGGRVYDFVTPMDLLRFTPLSLVDRFRAGLVSLYLQRQADGMKYEQTTAAEWIQRYAGPEVYRVIWKPLLRGKFGSRAEDVSMTWFWGKMRLRFGSRKGLAKESLGYMTGSFQVLIDALADRIRSMGGVIHAGADVTGITLCESRACGVKTGSESEDQADSVIATVPCYTLPPLAPALSSDYTALLNDIQYQAALVLVMQVAQPLSRIYWLNVSDPVVPFVAAIEQTNFLPVETYGGRRLVYCSNYVAPDNPLLAMSATEVLARYTAGLQRINPAFRPDWVQDLWLFKDRSGQPVVTRGYGKRIPDHRTPIRGLYLANTAQIYPEDRGMNYSVRLGQRIAALVHQDAAR